MRVEIDGRWALLVVLVLGLAYSPIAGGVGAALAPIPATAQDAMTPTASPGLTVVVPATQTKAPPTATDTAVPAPTFKATDTVAPTDTPVPTDTPLPTATVAPTDTPVPAPTFKATFTPTSVPVIITRVITDTPAPTPTEEDEEEEDRPQPQPTEELVPAVVPVTGGSSELAVWQDGYGQGRRDGMLFALIMAVATGFAAGVVVLSLRNGNEVGDLRGERPLE